MSAFEIGGLGIALMLALLALRIPVAFGLLISAMVGLFLLRGPRAVFSTLERVPFEFATHWTLSAVPMFLLMGTIAGKSGMTGSLYQAMRLWLGWLPGGLAVATNFAGAGFAAACGSSLATTASMGRLAVPEMLRAGYNPALATGCAAAVGTLGALIPPSIIMVLYAVFAEVSVGKMLLAGVGPGLLTAAIYAALIIARCTADPSLAPKIDLSTVTRQERLRALAQVWPIPVLALGVIGGIYLGIATPTEAGAIGAVLAALIAAAMGNLTWKGLWESIAEALRSTAMILFIAVCAIVFSRFMAVSGFPRELSNLVTDWAVGPLSVIVVICAIIFVMGCFLDTLGIMLLTLPIFLPILTSYGIDEIWIGVIIVKMLEIGLLTPPLGMNVFILKGVVGNAVPLGTIFRGVGWMLVAEVIIMALLIAFPAITLFLPSLMN
ncbi:TRAP transporter large permease subunit [Rhodobacterales bacterium HKCCE2091]|nr:TRAP transporter large permease subunit [Rhodobacterales bacterium HKCCE2091]